VSVEGKRSIDGEYVDVKGWYGSCNLAGRKLILACTCSRDEQDQCELFINNNSSSSLFQFPFSSHVLVSFSIDSEEES
jgi:hypothetical protein